MEKQWKKIIIDGKETWYSVSNYGEVRNDSTKTILGGNINHNGYVMVHLRQRMDKMCSVHRLVLKAFSPCENMDDLQVNHIDGDKTNNRLDNLEWSTALENMRHSYENNLQPKQLRQCHQYDLNGKYINSFTCCNEAAKKLGFDVEAIWECVTERRTICHGFQFKEYKKDKIEPWHNPKSKMVYVYNDDGQYLDTFNSITDAANAFGVSRSSISRYLNGSRKLKGFVFSEVAL